VEIKLSPHDIYDREYVNSEIQDKTTSWNFNCSCWCL